MLKKFKLDLIEVDTERSTVQIDGNAISVEPRVMDVLAYLATYPKEVISQETLFKELWPETTFSSGSVQRCIAQLRKVLGDDAKDPTYIFTHQKRGYSLEVVPEYQPKKITPKLWGIAGCIGLICIILPVIFSSEPEVLISGKLSPVTSTEYFDINPVYSSTGNLLAFIRKKGSSNEIIVKDLNTGVEEVVLAGQSDYESLTWSYDDEDFYFVVREKGIEWVGKTSSKGGTISRVHTTHKPNRIWSIADDQKNLYYLTVTESANKSPRSRVLRQDKVTASKQVMLTSSDAFIPLRLTISFSKDKLAIAGETKSGDLDIRLFYLQDGELSEPIYTIPQGFTEISWHPNDDAILVHHENQLSTVSLSGVVKKIPYFDYQRIFNPVFHPSGKKIAVTHTHYDTDLVEFDTQKETSTPVIDSVAQDYLARYSPSGRSFAFVSQRTGKPQIYIYQDGHEQLIDENNNSQSVYRAPVWSKNGKKVFFSFGNTLYEYSVRDQNTIAYEMPPHFLDILDTYSDGNSILIASKRGQNVFFDRFDLSTEKLIQLGLSGANYQARLDDKDKLVFVKGDNLYWGDRVVDISAYRPSNGLVLPLNGKLIFQSDGKILSYDGSSFTVVQAKMTNDIGLLIDVSSYLKYMFLTSSEDAASIAEIH